MQRKSVFGTTLLLFTILCFLLGGMAMNVAAEQEDAGGDAGNASSTLVDGYIDDELDFGLEIDPTG